MKHFYSTEARQALYELGVISHPDDLKYAQPEHHRVCRILAERHAGQKVSIIASVSEANMGQHIVRKWKDSPALVTLFRYVQHSFNFIISSGHI